MLWLVGHAGELLTKYLIGHDGRTALERLVGKPSRDDGTSSVSAFSPPDMDRSLKPRWESAV
eukprot:9104490-Alexandrium_andersonii.AAC.1